MKINGFSESFSELQSIEKQLRSAIKTLSDDLAAHVEKTNLPGVTECTEPGGLRCCTVSMSSIFTDKRMVLSPEFYIPAVQAEAVKTRMSSCQSVSQLCAAIKDMLETKRIRKGSAPGNVIELNPETLRVIAESEIGKYVLSQSA